MAVAVSAFSQTVYWDINKATAGTGTNPTGTWSTGGGGGNKIWSTSAAGTSSTTDWWVNGGDAVFSAGTDATGAYTVTVDGSISVSSILVEEGTPTFTGGSILFSDATPNLTINTGRTLNWGATGIASSTNILNVGGGGAFNLTQSGTFAGTLNLSGTTLRLTNSTLNLTTLNVTGNSTIDFAGAASSLSLTNFSIAAGATLTVLNWQYAVDTFLTSNWAGATQNTMGSAPMNRITFTGFNSSVTGWDSWDNQIRPNVPEPATYGALLIGAMLGFFAWRKRRASA